MLPDLTMGQGSSLNDADTAFSRSGTIYGDSIYTEAPNRGWIGRFFGGGSDITPAVYFLAGAVAVILTIKLIKQDK